MISINQELCIGCGLCAEDCVGKHISIENGKAKMEKECIQCGHCVAICPKAAVTIPEYDMADVEEIDSSLVLDPKVVLQAIKSRRSVRKYKEKKISKEDLEILAKAGQYTATAKNTQNCRFVFVQDQIEELKQQVWDYIEQQDPVKDPGMKVYASFNRRRKANPADDFLFRDAPVVVYIATDNPWDAGMAAQNIEMMAVSMGMGVLYNGFLARITDDNEAVKAWMGIEGNSIKACMLLGYPERKYVRTAPRERGNVIWK